MPAKYSIMRNFNVDKNPNKRHPTIYYNGILYPNNNEISGYWKFKYRFDLFFGFIPIPYRPGKGTWNMKLVTEN